MTGRVGLVSLAASSGAPRWTTLIPDVRETLTRIFRYRYDDSPMIAVDPATGGVRLVLRRETGLRTYAVEGGTGGIEWVAAFPYPEDYTSFGELNTWDAPVGIAVAGESTMVLGGSYRQAHDWCRYDAPAGLRLPWPCTRTQFLVLAYDGGGS